MEETEMTAAASVHTLTVRREVPASPAELFDGWLDDGKLATWMRPGDSQRSKVKLDPRVGGEFKVDMRTSSGEVPHTGTYKVIDRPNRLAFTWNSPAAGRHDSLVTIDFKPVGRATEVVLKHENLPSDEEVEGHRKGWTRILELMSQSYAQAA
jgi:uncharacterized protein YndB with AHSA1/START domain